MNNISKSIQWADLSWNPIKGLCPVGCWYCYAKGIYNRFKLDPAPRLDEKELFAPVNQWGKKGAMEAGVKRIFVCSTFDLFHPVADQWRDQIFQSIEIDPADTFIILTKLPGRIDRPMPKNVWLGVSMTGPADLLRWKELQRHKATVRFVSAEPLLEPYSIAAPFPDWMILGRLTGHGKKDDPTCEALAYIQADCKRENVPLFMKSNLSGIWPFKLVQEFPQPAAAPADGRE